MREQEINKIKNKIKNETKRKLNILDDEINDILEKWDVSLTTLKLRCIFWGKPYDFIKESESSYQLKKKNK